MKIVTIEPTPSPYSMKIVVDDMPPMGDSFDYKRETYSSGDPDYVQALFQIEGVKGIYRVADFLALERSPKSAWETILPAVREAFGEKSQGASAEAGIQEPHFGQVDVQVQTIHGVPMQIKLLFDEQEKRIGLPALFTEAAMEAAGDDNIVFARKWEEQYPRYGDPDQVGQDIYEELLASYSTERLQELVARAKNPQAPVRNDSSRRWMFGMKMIGAYAIAHWIHWSLVLSIFLSWIKLCRIRKHPFAGWQLHISV